MSTWQNAASAGASGQAGEGGPGAGGPVAPLDLPELWGDAARSYHPGAIIPPVRPVVTQFNVEVARCPHCGQRAQGRHTEQTSDALGAASVQLGPRAQGLAAEMKHAYGVPYRKTAAVLERGMGLKAAASALARSGQRLANKAEPTYQPLILTVRGSEVVCPLL
ncbi:MAG: hypothetical protein ACP5NB_13285, partial [Chloroflexia bacterium]